MTELPATRQLALFDVGWPAAERFPANSPFGTVREQVLSDLRASRRPLIVTGYTSLDVVVDFLADVGRGVGSLEGARILLGHEPLGAARPAYRLAGYRFEQEVVKYWLDQGISLHLSARVLLGLDLLRSGRVAARLSADPSRPVHAKIYKGDGAVTLGSSNFSHAGL